MFEQKRDIVSRTGTLGQFIDDHNSPGAPINGHGDPMATIPGQQWSIDGEEKISWKKLFKLNFDMLR